MRKEIKKQLQMIMDQAVKDNQIAGMNMMVIKDGQEEAYLQCGYADKANGKMIERDTIFRLFSMTKPITAAAAMILFERQIRFPDIFRDLQTRWCLYLADWHQYGIM